MRCDDDKPGIQLFGSLDDFFASRTAPDGDTPTSDGLKISSCQSAQPDVGSRHGKSVRPRPLDRSVTKIPDIVNRLNDVKEIHFGCMFER